MTIQGVSELDKLRVSDLAAARIKMLVELEQWALGNRSWVNVVGQERMNTEDLAAVQLLEIRYRLAGEAIERIKREYY